MKEVKEYLALHNFTHVKYNEPLSKHTTFQVGGLVSIFVEPESKEKLIDLIQFLKTKQINFKVIGNGSNLLPSDNDYNGVIIKTNRALRYCQIKDEEVIVGAGYPLIKLAYEMIEYRLAGIEFLGGIPGTIGGAVYMNAGAYNNEMKDVVKEVTFINHQGKQLTYTNDECQYQYRQSIFQEIEPLLIIEVKLKLEKGDKNQIQYLLENRKRRRILTQPLDFPSGGSTFRNPKGTHAYLLIDRAGLRGYTIGGAKVSEKHSNFVINYHQAKSEDIKKLVEYIQKEVYRQTGTKLQSEIEYFNW